MICKDLSKFSFRSVSQVVIADLLASTDHFADENLPNGRLAEKLRELDLKAKTFKYQDSKTEVSECLELTKEIASGKLCVD